MNTSEFARICRTERRTIHYYDAIGLLKPDHVQENGYREYSAEQVEQMDTIRILQSSGYTLKEIQKIMQAGSEARAEAFFAARDRIEERIRELQSMSDYIRKRKHQYEEFREIYPGYRIRELQIRYDSREVKEIEEHFFSFLYDGIYDTVYAGADTERSRRAAVRLPSSYVQWQSPMRSFWRRCGSSCTSMASTVSLAAT